MQQFIFGGDTGITQEELIRRRRLADAVRGNQKPIRTAWDGLSNGINSIVGALMERSASKDERAGRDAANQQFQSLFGGSSAQPREVAPPMGFSPTPVEQSPIPPPGEQWSPEVAAHAIDTAPMQMADAVQQVESRGNPNAVSPKGATGLMQVMPATARDPGYGVPDIFTLAAQMGRDVPGNDDATLQGLLRDPEVNRAFGEQYLGAMMRENGGDQAKALAAYNAGPGAVRKHGGIPPYPETMQYVQDVQGRMGANPGMSPPQPAAQPRQIDPRQVQGQPSMQELVAAYSNPFLRPEQKQVLGIMLEQRLATPEGMTEYQRAQLQMKQQEMQMRAAGQWSPGTNVNVNNVSSPGDTAWQKESAKQFAQRYQELTTQAANAADQKGLYDVVGAALDSGVRTGSLGAQEQSVRKLGAVLGIGDADKLAAGELIVAMQNRLALLMRNPDSGMGMPGAVSDRDLIFLKEAQFGLDRTPEGNRKMLQVLGRMADRKIEIARLADQYVQQNGRLDAGFNEAVRQFAEQNPLFNADMFGGQGASERAGGTSPPDNAPVRAPQAGAIEDGYRFKGGDPADPNNWEKL